MCATGLTISAEAVLSPRALQALNYSFNPDSTMTLQQFIIIFGCIQLVFSQVDASGGQQMENSLAVLCLLGPFWPLALRA